MTSMGDPIPLSVLALDLPTPATGWAAELERRGVAVVVDDLGRPAVTREVARALFAQHRQQQEAAARKRAMLERQAVEADQRFRAGLPAGIPFGAAPEGVDPAMFLMLADPERQRSRRRSVLEDALANDGTIYHPLPRGES